MELGPAQPIDTGAGPEAGLQSRVGRNAEGCAHSKGNVFDQMSQGSQISVSYGPHCTGSWVVLGSVYSAID